MKIIYEFDSHEDREDLEIHQKALEMYAAVHEYADWLRTICKYSETASAAHDECRVKLHEILNERGVGI